jgi:DNA-binding CsgD family transcriptional regulator
MTGVKYGILGVGDHEHGNHVCALYSGPVERDDLLMPFVQAGVREGDKCLCLIDQVEPEDVRQRLVDENDPGHELRAGQLDVDRASSVYLESGRFSAENMVTFLEDTANAAADNEFPHMRVAGEMSWVLPGPPGADEFFAYESSLNEVDTQIPSVLMCMYDLELFGTSMLVDVLKTHPKVLVGLTVLDNPEYLTPEEYLEQRRPAIPARSSLTAGAYGTSRTARGTSDQFALATIPPWLSQGLDGSASWDSLTEAERRIARLVASGMTNKLIADKLTLSRHTVDAHLKHIFTKLGIHSRVELTVIALRQGTRLAS